MPDDASDAVALEVRAQGLQVLARSIQLIAGVFTLALILGGVALIATNDEPTDVATGLILIFAGLFQALWIVTLGRTVEVVGGYVALRSRELFYEWSDEDDPAS